MYWMRSGGRNSKYNLGMTWAGDQTVDWSTSDGLKSSIIAASSLALSGVGVSHRLLNFECFSLNLFHITELDRRLAYSVEFNLK